MDRFWSKVDVRGPDECWPWTAAKSRLGYGQFAPTPKGPGKYQTTAHRWAWMITAEEAAPRGMHICHRCDNPGCCNPRHLFLGTPKENTADMMRKGRRVAPSTTNRARGERHASKVHPECVLKGEAHPQAKLTETEVRAIRRSTRPGVRLAEEYGVSNVTISHIRRRLIWRHVA